LSVAAQYLLAVQVIEELIQLAEDIRAVRSRGEESGSAEDVPTQWVCAVPRSIFL
jgi:hypothetical protein